LNMGYRCLPQIKLYMVLARAYHFFFKY
jgi:hypothetical protein